MTRAAGFFLHFYQPPRENPWLGLTPNEWSAWPYHDWNERITDECYRAVVAVALPDGDDGDTELYEPLVRSGFDVGPTLHHWLADNAGDVDQALRFQARQYNGSSATACLAAPLVHAILPLARADDRERLVAWGIADYRQRFGESPLGMWLPETAVNVDTLDCLARHGIRYTILMASQALRVRPGGDEWFDVDEQTLDTRQSYRVSLHEGRSMTVVFGHRELSQSIAFGDVLDDAPRLAETMTNALGDEGDAITLIVSDGETYGHHHRFADIGLAWTLRHLEREDDLMTSVGEWIAAHSAQFDIELADASAWSCAHGVERWRSDCGCTTGSQPGWNQAWRGPLRDALDWVRSTLGDALEHRLAELVASVDETLRDYGDVVATTKEPATFVREHGSRELSDDEVCTVLECCEIYRMLLYSYTSCAWFFADPADIETAIVLRYATVALERARASLGLDAEAEFIDRLGALHSNHPGLDGRVIWRRASEHYRFDARLVAAGFSAELLANGDRARTTRGHWRMERLDGTGQEDADEFLVEVVDSLTGRRNVFTTRAQRTGSLSARIMVRPDGAEKWTELRLGELGADVVARVTCSWLVGHGSFDVESALNHLIAAMLERETDDHDATALVALASSLRCASEAAQTSIRRALLALTSRARDELDLSSLAPLATSVGLGRLVGDTER